MGVTHVLIYLCNWLKLPSKEQSVLTPNTSREEEKEVCMTAATDPSIKDDQILYTFHKLQRVTAWIFRFINNCNRAGSRIPHPYLLQTEVTELSSAERYWMIVSQKECFYQQEITTLKSNQNLT